MNLSQQIQDLIDHAPQDGTTPQLVQAIAPVLELVAKQLKHPHYYVLKTLDEGWVMTTISQRTQPAEKKNVIYAFPSLRDASQGPGASQDPQVLALPVPVTHILFQILAMKTVDSVIFFEAPGNLQQGTEVTRDNFQGLIKTYLRDTLTQSEVPPNFA